MMQEFTTTGIPPLRRGAGFAAVHDMALMTQRLRQKGVEPGGANSFHPWVHLRVTPPDLASPSLLVNHPPTTDRKGAWAR
jgi:hypothetical protein